MLVVLLLLVFVIFILGPGARPAPTLGAPGPGGRGLSPSHAYRLVAIMRSRKGVVAYGSRLHPFWHLPTG